MTKEVKKLNRGEGRFINCTDYDSALEYAKQDSIKYLSWYIQSGYESENIEGTVFTPGDDPEKKISADELYNLFEQNKEPTP